LPFTMGMRSSENDWAFPPRVAACGVHLIIDIIDSPERSGVRLRTLTLFSLANPRIYPSYPKRWDLV
jgi:hypothetical protein